MNKKILIVNVNSIYQENATGITLRSIFEELDSDYLMELFWDGENNKSVPIKSYKLKYKSFSLGSSLVKLRKSKLNENIKKSEQNNNSRKTKRGYFSYLRQYIALLSDQAPICINHYIYEKIEEFKPDVIYTLGASVNALKLSYDLSIKYSVPIVIHHMDNWLHSIQWEDNLLLSSYVKKLRAYCFLCYSRSSNSIAISENMAEDFTIETGIKHSVIMNSTEISKYSCDLKKNTKCFNIIYAGGLHLGRYKSLIELGNVIENLGLEKEKIRLHIYTNDENIGRYGYCFAHLKRTILHKSVSHDKITEIYSKADVLLHVETTNLNSTDFFKYSISTKIPEYLSTGKPILLYCPDDIYLYKFMSVNKLAETVSSISNLKKALDRLFLKNEYELKSISKHNKEYAMSNFSKERALEIFLKVINNSSLPS